MSKRACIANKMVYFHTIHDDLENHYQPYLLKKFPLTTLTRLPDFWPYFANQLNTKQYRAINFIKHIFPSVVTVTLI